MNSKLIMVEGLPGSGKTTTAQIIYEQLLKEGKKVKIFLEGNLDHPADYDGVAFFSKDDYGALLNEQEHYARYINEFTNKHEKGYFIVYGKMKQKYGDKVPNALLERLFRYDIYELPLEEHIALLLEKWQAFTDEAQKEDVVYIFECCFIQNPVTIGMIRDGAPNEKVMDYVFKLNGVIRPLNPILFYVEQDDLKATFEKAVHERTKAWSNFFIKYYTGQGFGKIHNLTGIEGTIEVLEKRKELENNIVEKLDLKKYRINNTKYDRDGFEDNITTLLKENV